MYEILYTTKAKQDAKKLLLSHLKPRCQKLLEIIAINPYEPPYEKLEGDMRGLLSRRINGQHRLVYRVFEDIKIIKVLRMWSHYE